jgi:pimeloyl-ACP methyl ester carboxylesterase
MGSHPRIESHCRFSLHGFIDDRVATRFAEPMKAQIRNAELLVFENCSHAPLYENVQAFNEQTLRFLQRQSRAGVA